MKSIIAAIILISFVQAQVTITNPSNGQAPSVFQGNTFPFAATCTPAPCHWIVTGSGIIDSISGIYTAPNSVPVNNYDRGCSLLANNNIYNTDIFSAPVHSHSALWIQRIKDNNHNVGLDAHIMDFTPSFPINVVDSTVVPSYRFHGIFATPPMQDLVLPFPQGPSVITESGYYLNSSYLYTGQNVPGTALNGQRDNHVFAIDKVTCNISEIYMTYMDFSVTSVTTGNPTVLNATTTTTGYTLQTPAPISICGGTGQWAAINQCWVSNSNFSDYPEATVTRIDSTHVQISVPFNSTGFTDPTTGIQANLGLRARNCFTCNTEGMYQYFPGSNSLIPFAGTDAAGSPVSATIIHQQEFMAAVSTGQQFLNHSIRATFDNINISQRDIWPSLNGSQVPAHLKMHVTAASNTNPAILTGTTVTNFKVCPGFTYTIGCQFQVAFTPNSNGNWQIIYGGTGCNSFWTDTTCNKLLQVIDDGTGNPDCCHWAVYNLNGTTFDGTLLGPLVNQLIWNADWMPYGARFRFKSSFNVNGFCIDTVSGCKGAKIILRTLQHYGFINLDGGINFEIGAGGNETFSKEYLDANTLLHGITNVEQYLDIIDPSTFQINTNAFDGAKTSVNRTVISAISADNAHSASIDVVPVGAQVGVWRDKETIATSAGQTLIPAWITGIANQAMSCSLSAGIGTVIATANGCLYTPPNGITAPQTVLLSVISIGDNSKYAVVQLDIVPVFSDGVIRLALGAWDNIFTDVSGNIWSGALTPVTGATLGFFYDRPAVDGMYNALKSTLVAGNTWVVPADYLYYSDLWNGGSPPTGDIKVHITVPNGTYSYHVYGEPGYYADSGSTRPNRYNLEINGVLDGNLYQPFVSQGGAFKKIDITGTVTTFNNTIDIVARSRGWGCSISSLSLTPSNTSIQGTIIKGTAIWKAGVVK